MVDMINVVEQVKQGHYTRDWLVYRGQGNPIGVCTAFLVLTLLFLGASFIFTASLLVFLGFILLGLGMLALAYWGMRREKAKNRSAVIVLPEGFLECPDINTLELSIGITFAEVRSIELAKYNDQPKDEAAPSITYILEIQSYDDVYTEWTIDDSYKDRETIGKNIIAAYHLYMDF
jgi:hypothetical protein